MAPKNTGLNPFFLTGATAKVKIGGITMAYCAELQFSVQLPSAAPKILGMLESETIETLSYDVVGSFLLVRYAAGVASAYRAGTKAPSGVNGLGNGIGVWKKDNMFLANLKAATFFDLDVFQKNMTNVLDTSVLVPDPLNPVFKAVGGTISTTPVFKIKKCKIIGMDTQIGKRAISMQTFVFRGCAEDEESLTNGTSASWAPTDIWTPTSGDGTT